MKFCSRISMKYQQGMSLLETCLAMIISGIVLISVMTIFNLYQRQTEIKQTAESLATSSDALGEYFARLRRFPCPALIDLPVSDPNYGLENCAAARIVLGRDNLPVMIGMVPINTILPRLDDVKFSTAEVVDGYGSRLTYAVTASLTNAGTFNQLEGAIGVVDEFNKNVLDQPNKAHAILISHGKNRIGGYTREGRAVELEQCQAVEIENPDPGAVDMFVGETENCDDDAIFLSGLKRLGGNFVNDDSVRLVQNFTTALWRFTGRDTIRNLNEGNVGIGITDPREKLHVDTDIVARRVASREICSADNQALCMPVNALAGQGMNCPANHVLRGFERNAPVCVRLYSQGGGNGSIRSCSAGRVATGINGLTGDLFCTALPY
jgi:type II secretory pathway pseudopilin PulG